MTRKPIRRPMAMSLLEVVVVIAILVSVVVIAVPTYEKVQEKMKKVVCISRMKRIYHALNDYVQENGYWPQPPEGEGFMDEEEEWRWWILTMKDYGVSEKHWLCPVEEKDLTGGENPPKYAVSYIPTEFDRRQMTPYRWNQPWLTERGNFHRAGNHMLMPDGSVRTSPMRASFQNQ